MNHSQAAIATIIEPVATGGVGWLRRQLADATGCSPFDVKVDPMGTASTPSVFYVQAPRDAQSVGGAEIARIRASLTPLGDDVTLKDIAGVENLLIHAVDLVRLSIRQARPVPVRLGRPLFVAGTIGAGSTNLDTLTREEWYIFHFQDERERWQAYSLFKFGQNWLADLSLSLGWPVYEGSSNLLQTVLGEAMGR